MFSLTLRPEILSVNIRNHVGCLSWALSWAHISGPGSPYGFSRSSTSETSSRQRCESPNSSSREHVVLFPPHDNMQQGPTAPFTAIHASFSGPRRLGRLYQGRATPLQNEKWASKRQIIENTSPVGLDVEEEPRRCLPSRHANHI